MARRARLTRPPDHHRGPPAQHRPRARRLPTRTYEHDEITRHETAARFLAALAGWADPNDFLQLRYRLNDGQRMGQLFERPERLRRLATRAIALGRRTDVYVGCAPRTRRHGGRDAMARAFDVPLKRPVDGPFRTQHPLGVVVKRPSVWPER